MPRQITIDLPDPRDLVACTEADLRSALAARNSDPVARSMARTMLAELRCYRAPTIPGSVRGADRSEV